MILGSNEPVVSVVIPCYNSVQYIGKCVESVLLQDYESIEVIVIDDGSTDGSLAALQEYKAIKVISQANYGACVARNRGLKAARGKYIKFLDSDDFLEPGIIKRQVALAESLKETTIVYGDCYIVKGEKTLYKNTFISERHQTALLIIRDILIATPLHRKWMLEKVGGFDERFKNGQEWNLHVRLSSEGYIFHHQKEPVFSYRIHGAEYRISNNNEKEKEKLIYGVKKVEMTQERLGNICSGDVAAAIAMRYWWAARGFYRIGESLLFKSFMEKAKDMSRNYRCYWPLYYTLAYSFLGFRVAEHVLKLLISLRKKKYS